MISNFSTYKVKIRNEKFVNKKGFEFESTAVIVFYDEYKSEVAYWELGYIDTKELYKQIADKKPINIDDCFIEDFSFYDYRKQQNIPREEKIKIADFSANNTVFEARRYTDFSYLDFATDTLSFDGAMFIKGKVSFSNSKLGRKKNIFSNCLFNNGNVDFSNTEFGSEKNIFKNSIFKTGTKSFQFAEFGTGEVNFVNTDFGDGDVFFINTNFNNGDVSFKVARFGEGKEDFHYSKFGEGKISFEKVDFGNGYVNFKMVEFSKGRVNFIKSVFGDGDIDFEGCELPKGKLTMKKATFGKGSLNFGNVDFSNADLIFDHTIFNTDTSLFNDSSFKSISFKSCHLDSYFDLRVRTCEFIDLSDTIVRDIIDLTPYVEVSGIKSFRFDGMRLLGSIHIDWYKNNIKEIIISQDMSDEVKAEQFLILKENFNNIGAYDFEDKAYIEYKRHEEKVNVKNQLKGSKYSPIWVYPASWFRILVFDKAGLYATDPVRVLSSMFISYAVFSTIFVILAVLNLGGLTGCDSKELFTIIGDSFYFSAITYLTVGYGDFCPIGIDRWVASIEGFVGVFLMAYFTVAFVRKILR